jgi:hypothetical protein
MKYEAKILVELNHPDITRISYRVSSSVISLTAMGGGASKYAIEEATV